MNRFAELSNGSLTVETDQKTNSRVLYCQTCYTTVDSYRKTHLNDAHLLKKVEEFRSKHLSVQTMVQKKTNDFNSDFCEFSVLIYLSIRSQNLDSKIFPGVCKI